MHAVIANSNYLSHWRISLLTCNIRSMLLSTLQSLVPSRSSLLLRRIPLLLVKISSVSNSVVNHLETRMRPPRRSPRSPNPSRNLNQNLSPSKSLPPSPRKNPPLHPASLSLPNSPRRRNPSLDLPPQAVFPWVTARSVV